MLKPILMITILLSMFTTTSFGQSEPAENFDTRLLPDNLVENTDAILQVYTVRDGQIFPKQIQDMIVTSSDSSVIKILGIENSENSFITNVKIKAVESGTATISMAAEGFDPHDISLTVNGNKNKQAQLLIKTVPSTFRIGNANTGFVSVELADEDGHPVRASEDISVKLKASADGIILKNTELNIRAGEYFALGEFEVSEPRTTTIFASTKDMETVGSTITVNKDKGPLKVHLYVYPPKISLTEISSSYAYAIVQLEDSEGTPVIAKKNIPVSMNIAAQNKTTANSSGEVARITPEDPLVIKEGSYWAYTKLTVRAGAADIYDVNISTEDYEIFNGDEEPEKLPIQLELVNMKLADDEFANIDVLPILATGHEELIGVVHLDEDDYYDDEGKLISPLPDPIVAERDLQIKVDSSDLNILTPNGVEIEKGENSALLFGTVGLVASDELILNVASEKDLGVGATVHGNDEDSLTLVAQPAIPKVLAGSTFPLATYVTYGNGEATYFPDNTELTVSPNELVKIKSRNIHAGTSTSILDAEATKTGSATLSFGAGDYKATTTITNLSAKPTNLYLNHPDPILIGPNNVFSIEVLNENGIPLFVNEDKEIKLVSSDKSILDVPGSIIIKKDDYYTTFEVQPKKTGTVTIAALSNEIPQSKFDVTVEDFVPEIVITSPESISLNSDFDATVSVKYLGTPLEGLSVNWEIQGATIKSMETTTNANGEAAISLKSTSPDWIVLEPTVSGSWFTETRTSTLVSIIEQVYEKTPPFEVYGLDGIFILVPGALATAGFLIKRKGMLKIQP